MLLTIGVTDQERPGASSCVYQCPQWWEPGQRTDILIPASPQPSPSVRPRQGRTIAWVSTNTVLW